jgi:hypothetical protein
MKIRMFALALLGASSLPAALTVPAVAQDSMMMAAPGGAKEITITIENLTTGQGFSPSFFVSRGEGTTPLYALDAKASEQLVSVAEGGNIGGYSSKAAGEIGTAIGDARLAIHTLPGQTRTLSILVDSEHPFVDGVWMLGMTNDGFSGIAGVNAYELSEPLVLEVRGYDAGSEINNEKKGFLGALGEGNMRDPEDGVVTYHAGIRGDADAPAEWKFDPASPVARVTLTPSTVSAM